MNLQDILSDIRKVDKDFNLIEPNDHICIGVSGGKDSMVLLEAFNQLRKFKDYSFEITAIHLDLGFNEDDYSQVKQYCNNHNINFVIEHTEIANELLKEEMNGKVSCSKCSKYKKACIIQAALKHNCNSIAFAHHADDAIETLFMNMMHGGRISSFQPKIHLEKSNLKFIRPLIYTKESLIDMVAKQLQLPIVKNNCPNEKKTERQYIKETLNELYKHSNQIHDNFSKCLFEKNVELWKKDIDLL